MVETHASGLVFLYGTAFNKVIQCKYSLYYPLRFLVYYIMVCSSINIQQYYRTGIGSLHSLGEIELKQSRIGLRGLFLSTYGVFGWTKIRRISTFQLKNINLFAETWKINRG